MGDALRWIRNRWWIWRHRCRRARSSADCLTALEAQMYLHAVRCCYEPCRVCDETTCCNAIKRDVPLILPLSPYLKRRLGRAEL